MTAVIVIVGWCAGSVVLAALMGRLASLNRRRYPTVGERRG